MIVLLVTLCAASTTALKWDAPTPYDPVWFASLQELEKNRTVPDQTKFFWNWATAEDITFKLYTRLNPFEHQELTINDSSSLLYSNYNFDHKLKILCHGWSNNASGPMPTSLKHAYLLVSDFNIIVVDWGNAAMVNYVQASYNVMIVAGALTEFLNFIIREGVDPDDVHMVGHSLGAHVVGIAAGRMTNPIDSITGLDPALPLFYFSGNESRLDKLDAQHVEVIHTCAGYLGYKSPIGHMDFYPNGGTLQPGCGYDIRGLCSHNRSHKYLAEAILSTVPFTAVRCKDYDELYYNGYCNTTGETLIMGGLFVHYGETVSIGNAEVYCSALNLGDGEKFIVIRFRKEGIYYLRTDASEPFALGDDGI